MPRSRKTYDVEMVLDHRVNKDTGNVEYLIRWDGYTPNEDSWEPARNLNEALLEKVKLGLPWEKAPKEEEEPVKKKRRKESSRAKVAKTPTVLKGLWEASNVNVADEARLKSIASLLPKPLKNCAVGVANFFLFCYLRQVAWERRNRGEDTYSECPILQNYYFCNNYRELDRGTNYFRAHILGLWDKHGNAHGAATISRQDWTELVLWASICYRLVNRISTFEDFKGIPEAEEWPRFREFMMERHNTKQTLFTDAHQVCGFGPFDKGMAKLFRNENILKKLTETTLQHCENRDLQACCDDIKASIPNVGDFIAWQIVCDLMESQCLAPCTENDWAKLGPGAKNGIELIFGSPADFNKLELAQLLRQIQDEVFDALGVKFPRWNGVPLTLKNIEHPLCEFQKYDKLNGGSRAGQRRRKPRSGMDLEKPCRICRKAEDDEILLCDKCLLGYCPQCRETEPESDYWVCPACTKFEAVSLIKEINLSYWVV